MTWWSMWRDSCYRTIAAGSPWRYATEYPKVWWCWCAEARSLESDPWLMAMKRDILHDTPRLPISLSWVKSYWTDRKDGGVKQLFCLFSLVLNEYGGSSRGDAAGATGRYVGTGKWVRLGWMMWKLQRIKNYFILKRQKEHHYLFT